MPKLSKKYFKIRKLSVNNLYFVLLIMNYYVILRDVILYHD